MKRWLEITWYVGYDIDRPRAELAGNGAEHKVIYTGLRVKRVLRYGSRETY